MSHWPQCPLEWNWTGSSELNAAFNRNACSMWYCSCPCHRMRIFFLLTSNAHILPPENEFKKCINLNILLGLVGASQWTYLRHHCFHFLSFNLILTYLTFYLNKFTKVCRFVINIETVCSDAVKKQDGNTCYKELYRIVYCKNRVRCNKKQTPFVNTWKHSQACSWETVKTLRLSSRYSQKLAS